MPSTLRRNSSRGLDTCTSPPLAHTFHQRAQTPPTSRNACRRRGRSNGDSVRRRSLCRGSSRASSHASVIRKSNVSRRFETRGERMPQPPWPDESGLYRQPSAAHQPPPVFYGVGCRALATKRQSRWHRDFWDGIEWSDPLSQQPFSNCLEPWRHASDRDRTRPPPPPHRLRQPPGSTRRTPCSSRVTSPACASFGASPT